MVVFTVGMALELCMRRTYGKKAEYGLLLTYGAALVIEESIRLGWGSAEQLLKVPEAISGAFMAGDMIYSNYRFFAAFFGLGGDPRGVAVPGKNALWLDGEGRRP